MMKLFRTIPVWAHMETGTFMGGSALYWAHTLNGMGLENSRVITVDIGDFTSTAVKRPLWKMAAVQEFFKTGGSKNFGQDLSRDASS